MSAASEAAASEAAASRRGGRLKFEGKSLVVGAERRGGRRDLVGTRHPLRPAGLQVARGGEIATSGLSLPLRVTRLARRAGAVMARASARSFLLARRLPRALAWLQLFGEPRGGWVRVAEVADCREWAVL